MTKEEVLHLLSTNAMKTIIVIMFLATIPSGAEENQAETRGNELLLKHTMQYLQKQKQNQPSELTVDNNDGNLKVVPRPPRSSPPPPPPAPFDFFVLALQCQTGWDAALDDRFTTHGLWPQFRHIPVGKEKPSVRLPGGDFDYINKNQWPNATFVSNQSTSTGKSFSDAGFWTHEWAVHRSCSWISTQVEDTLNIFDGVDNKLRDIEVEPYMKCNCDPNNYDQLHEIHFWIRRDSYKFEDYPSKPKICTRQIIGFPRDKSSRSCKG